MSGMIRPCKRRSRIRNQKRNILNKQIRTVLNSRKITLLILDRKNDEKQPKTTPKTTINENVYENVDDNDNDNENNTSNVIVFFRKREKENKEREIIKEQPTLQQRNEDFHNVK